jgi:hypothetical protein
MKYIICIISVLFFIFNKRLENKNAIELVYKIEYKNFTTDTFHYYFDKRDSIYKKNYRNKELSSWSTFNDIAKYNSMIQSYNKDLLIIPVIYFKKDSIIKIEFLYKNQVVILNNCNEVENYYINIYNESIDKNYYSKNKPIQIIELYDCKKDENAIVINSNSIDSSMLLIEKKYNINDDSLSIIEYNTKYNDLKIENYYYNNTYYYDTFPYLDHCSLEEMTKYIKKKKYERVY